MIAGLGARRCRELRRYGGSGRPRETVTPSSVRNPGGRSDPAIRTAATSLRPLPSFGPRALPSFRPTADRARSEEHTSELQSLMRISYAVFCLNKKNIHID